MSDEQIRDSFCEKIGWARGVIKPHDLLITTRSAHRCKLCGLMIAKKSRMAYWQKVYACLPCLAQGGNT